MSISAAAGGGGGASVSAPGGGPGGGPAGFNQLTAHIQNMMQRFGAGDGSEFNMTIEGGPGTYI